MDQIDTPGTLPVNYVNEILKKIGHEILLSQDEVSNFD